MTKDDGVPLSDDGTEWAHILPITDVYCVACVDNPNTRAYDADRANKFAATCHGKVWKKQPKFGAGMMVRNEKQPEEEEEEKEEKEGEGDEADEGEEQQEEEEQKEKEEIEEEQEEDSNSRSGTKAPTSQPQMELPGSSSSSSSSSSNSELPDSSNSTLTLSSTPQGPAELQGEIAYRLKMIKQKDEVRLLCVFFAVN
jgi:hypothetical protein